MRSIKPGRGPSMMGGMMSLLVGIIGVVWTVAAASMGGGLFALFGIVFIIVAVVQAVYHFKNATSTNRYSAFDITDSNEEPDPLNEHYKEQIKNAEKLITEESEIHFCPYCGTKVNKDFDFCGKCGKKLPM